MTIHRTTTAIGVSAVLLLQGCAAFQSKPESWIDEDHRDLTAIEDAKGTVEDGQPGPLDRPKVLVEADLLSIQGRTAILDKDSGLLKMFNDSWSRAEDRAEAIDEVFTDNLMWVTRQVFDAVDLQAEVEYGSDVPRLVDDDLERRDWEASEYPGTITFTEHDWGDGRFHSPSHVAGELTFVGTIFEGFDTEATARLKTYTDKLGESDTYEELFERIRGGIGEWAIAARKAQLTEQVEAGELTAEARDRRIEDYFQAVNETPAIKPEHEDVLAASGQESI